MSIVLFLVFGFVVGLVARALTPGPQPMGLLMTTGLGIAGSFVGGFLVNMLLGYGAWELHATGFLGSLVGAMVLLVVGHVANGRSVRAA